MRTLKQGTIATIAVSLAAAGAGMTVVAQDEPAAPAAPVEFTGRLLYGPQTGTGTETTVGGRTEVRGNVFSIPMLTMSDPRLDGVVTRTNNIDIYDDPPVWVWQATWRIETEDGAWEGTETPLVFSDGSRSTSTVFLAGEGAYEGLTAVTEFDHEGEAWNLRGAIIDGEVPPVPVSPTTE